MTDTPGVTKVTGARTSKLITSKAWDIIRESDLAVMTIDCVKRLGELEKAAVVRLANSKVDPQDAKVTQSMKDGSFSFERLEAG